MLEVVLEVMVQQVEQEVVEIQVQTLPGNGDEDGTANTGGGAGGANGGGKSGGSGVVILKTLTSIYTGTTTGSPTVTTSGDYKIIKFTGSGSYTA
jgi:hypothetical protein